METPLIQTKNQQTCRNITKNQLQSFIKQQYASLRTLSQQKDKIKIILTNNQQLKQKLEQSITIQIKLQKQLSQTQRTIKQQNQTIRQMKHKINQLEHELNCERTFSYKKYDALEKKYMDSLKHNKDAWDTLQNTNQQLQNQLRNLKQNKHNQQEQLEQSSHTIKELATLIEKQNQTLKKQDQECNHLFVKNQEQQEIIRKLYQQYQEQLSQNKLKDASIRQMNDKLQDLTTRLSRKNSDWNLLMEIQKIRLGMRTLQKDEIDKIEDLIH